MRGSWWQMRLRGSWWMLLTLAITRSRCWSGNLQWAKWMVNRWVVMLQRGADTWIPYSMVRLSVAPTHRPYRGLRALSLGDFGRSFCNHTGIFVIPSKQAVPGGPNKGDPLRRDAR